MRKNEMIEGQITLDEMFNMDAISDAVDQTIGGTDGAPAGKEIVQEREEVEPWLRDDLYTAVGQFVTHWEVVSIGSVMRRFTLGARRAERILNDLAESGVINWNYLDTRHDNPLMTEEQFQEFCREKMIGQRGGAA